MTASRAGIHFACVYFTGKVEVDGGSGGGEGAAEDDDGCVIMTGVKWEHTCARAHRHTTHTRTHARTNTPSLSRSPLLTRLKELFDNCQFCGRGKWRGSLSLLLLYFQNVRNPVQLPPLPRSLSNKHIGAKTSHYILMLLYIYDLIKLYQDA